MTLQHRSSRRLALSIALKVLHMGKVVEVTKTSNITPFGAFIKLQSEILSTSDFIEMQFIDKHNNKNILQKGLVIHSAKEGIGVLFAYDTEEFRTLLNHNITV